MGVTVAVISSKATMRDALAVVTLFEVRNIFKGSSSRATKKYMTAIPSFFLSKM